MHRLKAWTSNCAATTFTPAASSPATRRARPTARRCFEIESFGLTSNNITYAVFGETMKYWDFFPASDPEWGRLNVWGYARVEQSRHPEVEVGMRVYGYLPCASHVVVVPDRIDAKGFVDAAAHRASLPSAYQGYRDVETDPVYSTEREAEHILFFPLFFTSFLIDDFLADEDFFGADTIVVSSASSKTAIIAAYQLAKRDGIEVVGLTSAGNREFVEGLGVYDSVHSTIRSRSSPVTAPCTSTSRVTPPCAPTCTRVTATASHTAPPSA